VAFYRGERERGRERGVKASSREERERKKEEAERLPSDRHAGRRRFFSSLSFSLSKLLPRFSSSSLASLSLSLSLVCSSSPGRAVYTTKLSLERACGPADGNEKERRDEGERERASAADDDERKNTAGQI